MMTENNEDNVNPFAGAEILGEGITAQGVEVFNSVDPQGFSFPPLSTPATPTAAPAASSAAPLPPYAGAVPWKASAPVGKVPRIFVDEKTGSIVEIAKKDQTFLRHVVELGPDGAADYAKISGGRVNHLLKLPAIQQYLRKTLDAAGITDDLLAQRIKEGLDATTQKEYCTKDGDLVQGEVKTDFKTRGEYVDRALRVQGLDKPEASNTGAGSPIQSLGALANLKPEELALVLEALKQQQARAEAINVEAEEITETPNDDTPSGGFDSPADI